MDSSSSKEVECGDPLISLIVVARPEDKLTQFLLYVLLLPDSCADEEVRGVEGSTSWDHVVHILQEDGPQRVAEDSRLLLIVVVLELPLSEDDVTGLDTPAGLLALLRQHSLSDHPLPRPHLALHSPYRHTLLGLRTQLPFALHILADQQMSDQSFTRPLFLIIVRACFLVLCRGALFSCGVLLLEIGSCDSVKGLALLAVGHALVKDFF